MGWGGTALFVSYRFLHPNSRVLTAGWDGGMGMSGVTFSINYKSKFDENDNFKKWDGDVFGGTGMYLVGQG